MQAKPNNGYATIPVLARQQPIADDDGTTARFS
jgi:hypothetical protein